MFKVGDRVFDLRKGWGEVCKNMDGSVEDYPVEVRFDDGSYVGYTADGLYLIGDAHPMLYHGEPQIIAPPEPKRMRKMWVSAIHLHEPGKVVVWHCADTLEGALDSMPSKHDMAFLVEVEVEDRRGGK